MKTLPQVVLVGEKDSRAVPIGVGIKLIVQVGWFLTDVLLQAAFFGLFIFVRAGKINFQNFRLGKAC